jgi:hypothetical protein
MLGGRFELRIGAMLIALAVPISASASLGGDESSVQADRAHMKGVLRGITRAGSYTVHEMQVSSGTIVREYVTPAGKVFAVAWEGPWHPDLRQTLGAYFDQFTQAAEAARARSSGRGPLNIREPGLTVQITGRPRAFVGRAFVPELVPQGVSPEAIR